MFIGIDCSTQSLKILVINEFKEKQKEIVINYDQDLPHYKTTDGIIRHSTNGIEHISTPTLLFVEALELAIERLGNEYDLTKIKAISASGQQHGSVWWKKGSLELMKKIMNKEPNNDKLYHLLSSCFSLPLSPIWMDSSTTIECDEMTKSLGSSNEMANITGSRAYERFTGPQIRHLYKHQPEIYKNTERISLISSFLSSILIGDYAPIDYSDGSGMNILDIHRYEWNSQLLEFIAPNLNDILSKPVASDTRVGFVSQYWCRKYGFSARCEVFASSGDNPCSSVGLSLNNAGDVGLSLGTSDVLFAVTNDPKPNPNEGSILIHPLDFKNYMMMLVYKNGATTRKHIRDLVSKEDKDWSYFNKCIAETPVGNNGCLSFYFIEHEITPNVHGKGIVKFNQNDEVVNDKINKSDCRGIIESQVLSYKHHAQLLGLNKIASILATGGGSVNRHILQIIADVFEMEVVPSMIANTAASGAAIRALNAYCKTNNLNILLNEDLTKSNEVIKPISDHFPIYRSLLSRYAKLEPLAVNILNKFNN